MYLGLHTSIHSVAKIGISRETEAEQIPQQDPATNT